MKNRVYYYDLLKIFACIGVIMIHVSMIDINKVLVSSYQYKVLNFYSSISRYAVPIFVMVSGANMLRRDTEISFKKLYGTYILRILIAFIFWSFVFCFVHSHISLYGFVHDNYHLWYLEMLIGLYMVTPLLKGMVQSTKNMKYFLILGLIFTFLIPNMFSVMKAFKIFENTERSLYFLHQKMYFYLPLGYTFYYVLGYYLSNIKISKVKEYLIYVLGVIGLLITIFISYIVTNHTLNVVDIFYGPLNLGVLLQATSVFVFFKKHLDIKLSDRLGEILVMISKCTFGIYLMHPLFIELFKISTLVFNPVLSVLSVVLLLFIGCLLVTFILNKVPKVKKWLV